MVPSTSGHPRHAEVDAEPIAVNAQLGTYTNFVNLLGWCALAVPAGFTAGELPFGVTFIAPHARDAALAGFGAPGRRAWRCRSARPTRSAAPRAADAVAPALPASAPTVAIAVVGAHLSGLPLNPQLLALGAYGREVTRTAPCYRLFALPDTTPPKPGMLRVAEGGARDRGRGLGRCRAQRLAPFLRRSPRPSASAPSSSRTDAGCTDSCAKRTRSPNAVDITGYGGWRAYLASRSSSAEATPGV